MSWYGRPWWIFFLYMTPTVMSVTAVFSFALPQQKKVRIDESLTYSQAVPDHIFNCSISNLPTEFG